ncbi:MAG: DNA primase small subunit domain-containing protein [Nanoarchaeota archaeon]
MYFATSLSYYKREDIRKEMVLHAKNKEVAVRFEEGFGRRPEVLSYPNDILEFAKQKAFSFHCSEELWKNPLHLNPDLSRRELDELRSGWDLVLDIDCKVFEYSKIAAYYTIKALRYHGIKSVTCKFSGNKGFHIGVPFEAFPDIIHNKPTKELFPEAPRKIAEYIKFLIKDVTGDAIITFEKGDFEKIKEKTGLNEAEITRIEKNEAGINVKQLNSESFLVIDTILISSRHMYRMPYSLHEKSGLVSVPIDPDEVLQFRKEQAKPEQVKPQHTFLVRNVVPGEATKLIKQAYDFTTERTRYEKEEETKEHRQYEDVDVEAIPEAFFPPCIKNIFAGLRDGKKRSVFVLNNFLTSVGWDKDKIRERIYQWNEQNPEKLREVYIKGQLRYSGGVQKKVPPPNCSNPGYYKDFGVCTPDSFCPRIKNPAQYAKLKVLMNRRYGPKVRKGKKIEKETKEPPNQERPTEK